MRSCATPPNTMAPRRPLPAGKASTQSLAGCRYQRVRGSWAKPLAAAARTASASSRISALYSYRRQITAGDHPVDHAIHHGSVRLHDVVAVYVLSDAINRLASGVRQHGVQDFAHAQDLAGVDVD